MASGRHAGGRGQGKHSVFSLMADHLGFDHTPVRMGSTKWTCSFLLSWEMGRIGGGPGKTGKLVQSECIQWNSKIIEKNIMLEKNIEMKPHRIESHEHGQWVYSLSYSSLFSRNLQCGNSM